MNNQFVHLDHVRSMNPIKHPETPQKRAVPSDL